MTTETAPTGHSIAWTLQPSWTHGDVACHEPDGADCRLRGGDDCQCESWGAIEHDEHGKPFHEVEGYDEEGNDIATRHYMLSGDCGIVEWIDNDGAEDCYIGPEHPMASGPIKPSWEGDNYGWTYLDEGVSA